MLIGVQSKYQIDIRYKTLDIVRNIDYKIYKNVVAEFSLVFALVSFSCFWDFQ